MQSLANLLHIITLMYNPLLTPLLSLTSAQPLPPPCPQGSARDFPSPLRHIPRSPTSDTASHTHTHTHTHTQTLLVLVLFACAYAFMCMCSYVCVILQASCIGLLMYLCVLLCVCYALGLLCRPAYMSAYTCARLCMRVSILQRW